MKSFFTYLSLLLAISGSWAQSGLSNLDFETTSSFIGMGCSTPTPFPTGFNRSQACTNGAIWSASQYTLSPSAQSGNKYISINNVNTCGHVDLQPISFGFLNGNTPGNGSPYTNKPTAFCGYYRAQGMMTSTDSVFVLVYLTKNGVLVGKGKFSANGNQASWTNFCANITYYSALTPDTVRIRFTPSGMLAGNGTSFTSQTIYFDIDNCSFSAPTAVADLATQVSSFNVYPNPANEKLIIQAEVNNALEVEIYNCLGQLVKKQNIQSGKNTIPVTDLEAGIYFVKLQDKNKTLLTRKAIVTH